MRRYTIGIDFGTLSARAVMLNADNGNEVASAEQIYSHAVMSEKIPCGVALEADVALQHPQDYLDALSYTVKKVVEDALKKEGVEFYEVSVTVNIFDDTSISIGEVLILCSAEDKKISENILKDLGLNGRVTVN